MRKWRRSSGDEYLPGRREVRIRPATFDKQVDNSECVTSRTTRERFLVASGSVGAMIPRLVHLCFRKLGSICIDGGVSLLMNTGRSVCDLNRHTLSLSNTHSLIKSATIGGFD
jgi:hypothetical protein